MISRLHLCCNSFWLAILRWKTELENKRLATCVSTWCESQGRLSPPPPRPLLYSPSSLTDLAPPSLTGPLPVDFSQILKKKLWWETAWNKCCSNNVASKVINDRYKDKRPPYDRPLSDESVAMRGKGEIWKILMHSRFHALHQKILMHSRFYSLQELHQFNFTRMCLVNIMSPSISEVFQLSWLLRIQMLLYSHQPIYIWGHCQFRC